MPAKEIFQANNTHSSSHHSSTASDALQYFGQITLTLKNLDKL
jgi:hypothetical protein